MSIDLTIEDIKKFEQNDFSQEKVLRNINKWKSKGISDDIINQRLQKKLSSFPKNNANSSSDVIRPKNKGIDLTPSGLLRSGGDVISSAAFAPFTAISEKIPLNEAFNKEYQTLQDIKERNNFGWNKGFNNVNNFLTDLVGYSALPVLKGGTGFVRGTGNFLGNAVIQGGIPGALEALKQGNNPLQGAGVGTGTAAAIQAALPPTAKIAGTGVSKIVNSEFVKNNLPKILEGLTSVPSEYSKRALEKELAGNSILQGKFDPKTAYRPIEEKLTSAKNNLIEKNNQIKNQYKIISDSAAKKYEQKLKPDEYFDTNYKKISDNALKSLEEEKIRRAQAVNEALNDLPENVQFKAADLRNDIQNITDSYSLSGNPELNYGLNAAQGRINQIEDLLYGDGTQRYGEFVQSIKDLEFPKNYLDTITNRYKNTYHKKVLDNINNDIVYAQRNFNKNILDKIRKNPEILQNPEQLAELEHEVSKYANLPYDEVNQEFYNKFYEALGKGDILQKGQNFVTPKELYDINKNIDRNMINWDKAGENTANGVLEQIYGKYADRLNNLSPELANANEAYSYLMNAQKAVGGIDPRTFGTKLRDYNSGSQIRNGMSEAFRNLDNTLPAEQRFLPQVNKIQKEYAMQKYLEDNINQGALRNIANFDNLPLSEQNILNSIAGDEINAYRSLLGEQNEIKNILQTVGNQYQRNPKLLANRNDLKFENALEDLQNRSGINFMDDLLDVRARDALERIAPGQGGGSGSEQGIFNNVIRPAAINSARVLTAGALGNTIGGPFGAAAGLLSISPKFMARGTIKNLGRINNIATRPLPQNFIQPISIPAAMYVGGNYEDEMNLNNFDYGY